MKLRFKIKTPNPAASMNRIAKITHYKSDLTTKLFELDYPTFDDNGNRTELVRTVFPFVDGRFGSGSKVNWEYDLTSQLSFERYFLANQTEFLTQEYLNDDAGNRETHNVNYFDQSRSVAGTYNAANELTGLEISSPSTSPTNVTFEHNKRGGRTKMTTNAGGSDSVVVNYGYNEDNSMTQYGVVAPGRQLNVAFAYSGGLRVEKQVTGFITTGGQQQVYNAHKKYLLDGVDVLLELQVIGSTEYVTVLNIPGVLSATLIEGGASVVRYQLHDAQGNVIGLVDTDQEVGPVYLQDSWGIPLVDSDCQTVSLASSPIQVESVPNPYRWGGAHGYYADEDVGMYLMGYRWYDSFTGRFISRDPFDFVSGDMNLYRPLSNNPVNQVDPWGLNGDKKWGFWDTVQAILDVGGTIEPTPICDLVNAGISVCRGNYGDAAVSVVGVIPYLGDTAKLAKYGVKAADMAATASTASKAASKSSEVLKRAPDNWESTSRLSRQAADAEQKTGIHGVSVTAGNMTPPRPHSTAPRGAVESKFPVHDTPSGNNPLHRTVELPKPVTPEVTKEFNEVFGRQK